MKHLITLALSVLTASSAFAGEEQRARAPAPSKEIEPMYCMLGTWSGTGNITMGGQKVALKVSMTCEQSAASFGVLCRTKMEGPGMPPAEETDLFGYDVGKNQYHWFSVTSRGDAHDHVAEAPKGPGPIVFAYSGLQEGKPMQEVIKLTISEDHKRLELRNDGVVEGQPAWVLTGVVTKK